MKRYDNSEKILNKELNKSITGFIDQSFIDKLKGTDYSIGTIYKGMEYRPDKISSYYYGVVDYAWILSTVNTFVNGVADFYLGRKIIVPSITNIQTILSSKVS